jgi:peptidoglycan/LPS O-acetylase OafA/YrhL
VTTIRRLPISAAWVAALGGMTYPLYSLHQHVGYMIFNRWGGQLPAAQPVLLASIAMIATSYLIWRLIDRPSQNADA